MLIGLYKTAMRLSTPFLETYLQKRARAGKEDVARATERRGRPVMARPAGRLIWCHAASVGESLSLLSVIERMIAEDAQLHVMVTTGTVTSAKLMASRLPARAFHQYVPVDHPAWVATFLDHWKPDAVVWTESEFWPAMLGAVAERKIPAMLLNARMSEESFRRWSCVRGAAREVLSVFSLCIAQNEAEAARLIALGAGGVRVGGNLKYAAAPLPFDAAALAALQNNISGRPAVFWASTHAGEEEIAVKTHQALAAEFPDLLTVIAPRHPARGDDILSLCAAAVPRAVRRTDDATIPRDASVYIADTMGEIGLFCNLIRNVVMGGCFADIGGHNPIEPAQAGCVIFFGPKQYNFIGIMQDFRSVQGIVEVADENDLAQKLGAALRAPKDFASVAEAGRKMVTEKSAVVSEITGYVRQLLKNTGGAC